MIRPIKELKGFTKVNLQPNETKSVNLKLIIKDSVSFFDEYANQWSVQLGQYKVHVGNSSDNTPLTESFTIEKSYFGQDFKYFYMYICLYVMYFKSFYKLT